MTDDTNQRDEQRASEENRSEAIAPSVWIDRERFDDSEIAAMQQAAIGDRELVSIPADLAQRCRNLARFDRQDLSPEEVLAQCAKHGTLDYEDALDLYQWVEMPNPARDAQAIVDEELANTHFDEQD